MVNEAGLLACEPSVYAPLRYGGDINPGKILIDSTVMECIPYIVNNTYSDRRHIHPWAWLLKQHPLTPYEYEYNDVHPYYYIHCESWHAAWDRIKPVTVIIVK